MPGSTSRNTVLVYVSPGVGLTSASSLVKVLGQALPNHEVHAVPHDDLLDDGWHAATAMLVIPGGVDRPYMAALGEEGIESIKRFVRDGGVFFGVCAGAYFAANVCHFVCDDGTVLGGPRPLGFFPGTASGPLGALAPGFDGDNEATAAMAALTLYPGGTKAESLYWGGPEFVAGHGDLAGTGGWRVLARYDGAGGAVAAVDCGHGLGRAVLSGTHPELAFDDAGEGRVVAAQAPSAYLMHLLNAAGIG